MILTKTQAILTLIALAAALASPALAQDNDPNGGVLWDLPVELHGFYEMRAGYRLRNDKHEKDMSIMENRLQLELSTFTEWADFKGKGDIVGDLVEEQGDFDLREAYMFTVPRDYMDVKIGRQILTWGTGDLIFINDLFPKDWQSFFIGRDPEYLKAPSDAAKVSFFTKAGNLDIVYTPQFDPDRFLSGRRLSYWNSSLGRLAGQDAIIHTDKPDRWFRDSEIAARLYKTVGSYELALYGYRGFWKSPAGLNSTRSQAVFPDLNVYGASIRGTVGKGIGNLEAGYYDSADDRSGKNPLINNSEIRYLAGYSQEIGKDFTMGLQYYVEHMLNYSEHKKNIPVGLERDRQRRLITVRLTKLLMKQDLACSVFTYFSPTDEDVYMRPNVRYKASDNLTLEVGGNIFFGEHPDTFFGQFRNNTNIYTAVRYSF